MDTVKDMTAVSRQTVGFEFLSYNIHWRLEPMPSFTSQASDSVPLKRLPHAGPVLGSRNIIGEIGFVRAKAACGGWVQVLSDLVVEQLRLRSPVSPGKELRFQQLVLTIATRP